LVARHSEGLLQVPLSRRWSYDQQQKSSIQAVVGLMTNNRSVWYEGYFYPLTNFMHLNDVNFYIV